MSQEYQSDGVFKDFNLFPGRPLLGRLGMGSGLRHMTLLALLGHAGRQTRNERGEDFFIVGEAASRSTIGDESHINTAFCHGER